MEFIEVSTTYLMICNMYNLVLSSADRIKSALELLPRNWLDKDRVT